MDTFSYQTAGGGLGSGQGKTATRGKDLGQAFAELDDALGVGGKRPFHRWPCASEVSPCAQLTVTIQCSTQIYCEYRSHGWKGFGFSHTIDITFSVTFNLVLWNNRKRHSYEPVIVLQGDMGYDPPIVAAFGRGELPPMFAQRWNPGSDAPLAPGEIDAPASIDALYPELMKGSPPSPRSQGGGCASCGPTPWN